MILFYLLQKTTVSNFSSRAANQLLETYEAFVAFRIYYTIVLLYRNLKSARCCARNVNKRPVPYAFVIRRFEQTRDCIPLN